MYVIKSTFHHQHLPPAPPPALRPAPGPRARAPRAPPGPRPRGAAPGRQGPGGHRGQRGLTGKSMGNPWEIHGKSMGNPWEIHGKSMGNPWEIHGNPAVSWGFPQVYLGMIMGVMGIHRCREIFFLLEIDGSFKGEHHVLRNLGLTMPEVRRTKIKGPG